jgi:hypothetical protein
MTGGLRADRTSWVNCFSNSRKREGMEDMESMEKSNSN